MAENFDAPFLNVPVVDNVLNKLLNPKRRPFKIHELFILAENVEKQSVVDALIVAVFVDGNIGILQIDKLRVRDSVGGVGKFLRLFGEH